MERNKVTAGTGEIAATAEDLALLETLETPERTVFRRWPLLSYGIYGLTSLVLLLSAWGGMYSRSSRIND